MEISEIFGAAPKNSIHLLSEGGVGFYVPPYQRPYTWGRANLQRLFEDIGHGIRKLLNSSDATTFIGTLILIHDVKHQTIHPLAKGQLPKGVMLVIDGQQRLTTLLLLNSCLHEEIVQRAAVFKDDQEEAFQWIYNMHLSVSSQLFKTLLEDKDYGDQHRRFYPRMIRAYDDSWSRNSSTASYTSPIAKYLDGYSLHVFERKQEPYSLSTQEGGSQKLHEVLSDNRRIIRKLLESIADGDNDEAVSLAEIANSENIHRMLFNSDFPSSVCTILASSAVHTRKQQAFCKLTRLLVVARYLLERVTITEVTAKNEDYAFDMFESLNTTGEPLTAYETFKPRVIHEEGLGRYEASESRKFLAHVEAYLDKFKKAQDRQQATNALLLPFALAESGEKLGRRLSEQRRYLRDEYDRHQETEAKREFLQHLSHSALLLNDGWCSHQQQYPKVLDMGVPEKDCATMCLGVLREAKHDIVLAPLTRFYSRCRVAGPMDQTDALQGFVDAIKAMTAFFAFWRGSRIGTSGIDRHYRTLMREAYQTDGILPLARTKSPGWAGIDSENLRKAFRHILRVHGDISGKADWRRLAPEVPIYRQSIALTRLLLLAATHDTTPDSMRPGLVTKGRVDVLPMLTREQWYNQGALTVEHIAPQTHGPGWDASLYEKRELVDRLGNLTLLPNVENASTGNRPWTEKRLIYRLLSSSTPDELDERLEAARNADISIGDCTEEVMRGSKYTPHVRAVGEVSGNWSLEMIRERGENLADLIWDRLSPWLGF
jgi:hypothetical protein